MTGFCMACLKDKESQEMKCPDCGNILLGYSNEAMKDDDLVFIESNQPDISEPNAQAKHDLADRKNK